METGEVLSRLPHRHPYLLIDRVITIEPGKRVVAVKAVTYTEYCLAGHFPGDPVYPGAFMIEAASQAAGLLRQKEANIAGNLVEIVRFQFKKPVRPGHLIVIEALQNNAKGPFLLADVTLTVNDTLVARGSLQIYTPKNS
jgi:3-hydroxyacyl-[acyl-carrier-protein] dehydratase